MFSLKSFPNPVTDHLTIDFDYANGIYFVRVSADTKSVTLKVVK